MAVSCYAHGVNLVYYLLNQNVIIYSPSADLFLCVYIVYILLFSVVFVSRIACQCLSVPRFIVGAIIFLLQTHFTTNNSSFVCFLSYRSSSTKDFCVFCVFARFLFRMFCLWVGNISDLIQNTLALQSIVFIVYFKMNWQWAIHIIFVMTLFSTIDALMCSCRYAVFRCFMSQAVIINNHRCCYRCEERMKPD